MSILYKSEVFGPEGLYAKVVTDSVAENSGIRLTTLEIQAPKFIDAEFEKHRMLSSNSSSTRAIPFSKAVNLASYFPFDVRKNEKGMQGYEKISNENLNFFHSDLEIIKVVIEHRLFKWKDKIHKQHLGRYIDPFTLQKKVVTATEWDNFFKLRLADDAQPEMQELARLMKRAIEQSVPNDLAPGNWHLPYTNYIDNIKEIIFISAARCARVSYLNVDNSNPNVEKDLELANRLLESGHLTPFEHQATPANNWGFDEFWDAGISHMDRHCNLWSGNLRGWIQNRKLIESENDSQA